MMVRFLISFLAIGCLSFTAWSQPYTSNLGRFQVDQVRGCAPLTVTITIILPFECDAGNACGMDFEGNNNFQPLVFTHTYTQPGEYDLGVIIQTSGLDEITINVLPNTQPEFDIYTCGSNEVQVRVTDTNYNQYVIEYNDGSPEVVVPSGTLARDNHTFASAGLKTIQVRGRNLNADDNCNPMVKNVTALDALPAPTITELRAITSTQASLEFNNEQNILYRLEIATNNTTIFQQLQPVYNTTIATVDNLLLDNNFYCFRLGAFDPCNNTTVYSNTICTANVDLLLQNNNNRFTWITSPTGVTSYSISKNTEPPLAATNTATFINDSDIVCGTTYCYQLTANYANGSRSISLEKCGEAVSTTIPSAIADIATVVGDNQVTLTWEQDPAFTAVEYSLFKLVNGAGTPILKTTNTAFTDTEYNTENNTCYSISYIDACGNTSPRSLEACPIQLTGTVSSTNVITLTWTPYTGYEDGVSFYQVEKYSPQGQLLSTENTTDLTLNDPEFGDPVDYENQVHIYIIRAIPTNGGLSQSVSNTITILKEPNLTHPTAFTPNGDGDNDVFKVFSQFTAQFEMQIFNRWGEMMFSTTNLSEGWDGTFKGAKMPEGTYVFKARITDLVGRTFQRSGSVLLLKRN